MGSWNEKISFIVMFFTSLNAELIVSMIPIKSLFKNKMGFLRGIIKILVTICVAIVILFVVTVGYTAFYSSFLEIINWDLFLYLIKQYWIPIILIPFAVTFMVLLVSTEDNEDADKRKTKIKKHNRVFTFIKWGIVLISIAVLVVSPRLYKYEWNSEKKNKDIKYIYITKLDANSFVRNARDGYDEKELQYDDSDTKNPTSPPSQPEWINKDISDMSFNELLDAAIYYNNPNDNDSYKKGKKCIKRAYNKCKDNLASYNQHDIGMMWYYKGCYDDDGKCFYNAGEAFESVDALWNAALSYIRAYNDYNYSEPDKALLNFKKFLGENLIKKTLLDHKIEYYRKNNLKISLSNEEKSLINGCENSIVSFLSVFDEIGLRTPYLSEFTQMMPNDLCVQIVNINSHILDGSFGEEDIKIIRSFLKQGKYKNCPKLLLAEAYYNTLNQYNTDLDKICDLFENHFEYFEPEDIINLAGLLYEHGEYDKAGEVAKHTNMGETNLLQAMVYLTKKGSDDFVMNYFVTFYPFIKNYRDEFERHYGSKLTYQYDLNTAYIYSEMELAGEGTKDVKALYNAGLYDKCLKICNDILKGDSANNDLKFIKADVLVKIADNLDEGFQKELYYDEAEDILDLIMKETKSDYIKSINGLYELYKKLNIQDIKLREYSNILEVIKSSEKK